MGRHKITPPTEVNEQSTIHRNELIRRSGYTEEWLLRLVSKGKLSPPDDGQYPLLQVFQQLIEYLKAQNKEGNLELTKKRVATEDENILLKRVRRKKLEGMLLDREAVEKVWADHIVAARQIVTSLPLTKKQRDSILRELEIKASAYDR